jgi:hypothetical protein
LKVQRNGEKLRREGERHHVMKSEDYGKELWTVANLVTGFFVAQYLAAAIALGDTLDDLAKKRFPFKITISLIAVGVGLFYCGALQSCRTLAASLDSEKKHDAIWARANAWRMGCILLFTLLFIFAVFEHNIGFLH